MALSSRAFDRTEPCAAEFTAESKPTFLSRLDRLKADVVKELQRQGFANDRIELECYLNMRVSMPKVGRHHMLTSKSIVRKIL